MPRNRPKIPVFALGVVKSGYMLTCLGRHRWLQPICCRVDAVEIRGFIPTISTASTRQAIREGYCMSRDEKANKS